MHNEILRLPTVLTATGMSRSWLYAELMAGRIPGPLRLNLGTTAWKRRDVQTRLESCQRRVL